MLHWLSTAAGYVLHPLHGNAYLWWSGAGSDLGEVTLAGLILGAYRHRNCHQRGCWRLGHNHPEHGFPVCRRHYRRGLEA